LKKGRRVVISAEVPVRKREVRRLKRSLVRMLDMLAVGNSLEVSVALVDEEIIRELNRRYLNNDKPTDVLAFPLMSSDELSRLNKRAIVSPEPLGDIVICIPIAARQAAERNQKHYEEIELLAAHGLLHLLGYEDETERGAGVMTAAEKQLLGRSIIR
jgi:probable rRNA maturation factor